MKNLASIGIKDFKNGMFSSDATELRGHAILLENIVYDEELGKAIKAKDSNSIIPSAWSFDHLYDSAIFSLGDVITYSNNDNDRFLVVAMKELESSLMFILFFQIGDGNSLTYDPARFPDSIANCEWMKLNTAGGVLRYSFKQDDGTTGVKWYGDIGKKDMFFVGGEHQVSYSGYITEDARPFATGIAFDSYSLGTTDIEADDTGLYPDDDEYVAPSIKYYKSYKLSVQVDDSQESEFADLLISTDKISTELTIPIRVTREFSKRLSKIHIWRRISKDAIDYNDSHELIKTLDVAKDEKSSTFSSNIVPILNVNFSHQTIVTYTGAGTYSKMRVRVMFSERPNGLAIGNYLGISYLGNMYYWDIEYIGDEYLTLYYNGHTSFNQSELALSDYPAGAGPAPETFNAYRTEYEHPGIRVPGDIFGTIVVSSNSPKRIYLDPANPITPSAFVGAVIKPVDSISTPEGTIEANTSEMIETDVDMFLSSSDENEAIGYNIYGATELVSDWSKDGDDFVFNFVDDKPFSYATGQFYSEEHGILRGDYPYYSHAISYNNRLFVIDGNKVRWSKLFRFDMFEPEAIHEGKFPYNYMVVFREILFLFSDQDVLMLNYSGTEVNWRTSDTIGDKGTRFIHSITVTPIGVFFAAEDGIYLLAASMQMGKQSYTEFQKIDDPIKDQFDFSELADDDLVGHYDAGNQRWILSNKATGVIFIFSLSSRGWFLRKSVDYPSIDRAVNEFVLQRDSAGLVFATDYDESIKTTDYARITTGWFYVGDPHNKTWFREIYLLLKNGRTDGFDQATYFANVSIILDSGETWDLGSIEDMMYIGSSDDALFFESLYKINSKLKKFRLKIYSNYPIFEYDNLEITYTPTGTY